VTPRSQPGGVAKTLTHILDFELRKLRDDLLRRVAGSEVAKHDRDRDANAANAGLATAYPRINRDSPKTLHDDSLALAGSRGETGSILATSGDYG